MAASYRRNFTAKPAENKRSNELEELCVFGYSCKLFRDDVRARQIDDSSTLIPWMGNGSLLIDRFDGRGHLFSLDEYDVTNVKHVPPTEQERAIEKACDEERYLELHVDVREKEMYEEEEVKRLYESLNDDSTYTAVQFSYENPAQHGSTTKPTSPLKRAQVIDEDTEPFLCPPDLRRLLPGNVLLPPTTKLNNIIVKTALFVAQHGGQFEIMIKTKQKDNVQFKFMDIDHALNRYYKLMIELIKSRKYSPPAPPPEEKVEEAPPEVERRQAPPIIEDSESSSDEEGFYLHPSLVSKNKPVQRQSEPEPEPEPEPEQEEILYYQYPQFPPVPAPTITPPPPNLKPIIDKMAEYVARNGAAFEQNVRQKGDTRFQFLTEGHMFHPYYINMKEKFLAIVKEENERQKKNSDDVQQGKTGVSFSIKVKDPEPTITPKPASVRLAEESESESSDSESDSRGGSRGGSVPRGGLESRETKGSRTSTPTRIEREAREREIRERESRERETREREIREREAREREAREREAREREAREREARERETREREVREREAREATSLPSRYLEELRASRVEEPRVPSRVPEDPPRVLAEPPRVPRTFYDHNEESIPDVLEHRLDNGAQKDVSSQKTKSSAPDKDKLAERKRKALAFVSLLKRTKTDGSLNLDVSNSPERSKSITHSPLPDIPDI